MESTSTPQTNDHNDSSLKIFNNDNITNLKKDKKSNRNNSTGHVDDLEEQPLLLQLLKLTSNLQGDGDSHDKCGNDGNDAANGLSRKNILEHHLIFFNADIRGLTDKITQSQHNQQYLNISLHWNEPVDTALLHSIAWDVERELLPLSVSNLSSYKLLHCLILSTYIFNPSSSSIDHNI
nr:4616_t:CDS:2 [Entrophospora candida]